MFGTRSTKPLRLGPTGAPSGREGLSFAACPAHLRSRRPRTGHENGMRKRSKASTESGCTVCLRIFPSVQRCNPLVCSFLLSRLLRIAALYSPKVLCPRTPRNRALRFRVAPVDCSPSPSEELAMYQSTVYLRSELYIDGARKCAAAGRSRGGETKPAGPCGSWGRVGLMVTMVPPLADPGMVPHLDLIVS